ncbi:Mor transcription activator family protein [Desulfoluna spongiiphila]|uniref:Transcriptional regulator, Middle operon regulator (Mor) family n=1 Tax=Desulfoluna spongiiphila TaxID=419481 RepID=A0A1G5I4L3_9BACT|nr:Mor transcription activator family protein [Desulfoluna spongiiphila]SCY71042.1 Transcriptional regulator, Middle operon regulator (Mor) family [Desulfoluna spongiiphila]VVS92736.1 mor transcription activator [Desulfoluna spongiiphila]
MKKDPEQLKRFDPNAMDAKQVLNTLDPSVRDDPRLWPTLLAELVDVVDDHFRDWAKMEPEVALEWSQNVIVVIAHYLGGRNVYLPRDDKLKRAIRDAMIFRLFDGCNQRELSRKTGLTTAQIYNIIRKQRTLRKDRHQRTLPFE